MNNRYIALDCEMGGIDLKYSLLTAYFAVLDSNLYFVDELYLFLKPDDETYVLSAGGMGVNKIDLVVHDTHAITYNEGRAKLGAWLRLMTENGKNKLTAVGHNVVGDIRHIWSKIYAREKWEQYVSYRNLDTGSIAQFLKLTGGITSAVDGPEGVSGSLSSLAKFYGIPMDETKLHDAKVDTLLTVEVLKAMVRSDEM